MLGSSRESYAALRAGVAERRTDASFAELAQELFSVADLLGRDKQLRSALADAGQPAEARKGLVSDLFGSRLSPLAVALLSDAVGSKWTSPADFVDAIEGAAAQAAFLLADNGGSLDRVEGELYKVQQALSASPDLQLTLTSASVSAAAKQKIVTDLLADRADPTTVLVSSYGLSHLRGRRATAVVESMSALAAEQRNRSVAEVRSVVALDDSQRERLGAALAKIFGRQVRLNVSVDPSVIGGASVRVGDQIIDGTIAARLDQAQRAVLGN